MIEQEHSQSLSKVIALIGGILGIVLSIAVFSGDSSGRVNLLYLLLLFVGIPIVGALVSLIGIALKRGAGLSVILSRLPIWTPQQKRFLTTLQRSQLIKPWLFKQSQQTALAFAFSTLIVFLVMLLATDVNVVWRSTLLTPQQLYSILSIVALPWSFWDAAQPSIELIAATQDSRLSAHYQDPVRYGQWWRFLLATQLAYGILTRLLLFVVARIWLNVSQRDTAGEPAVTVTAHIKASDVGAEGLANDVVVDSVPTADAFILWHDIPLSTLAHLHVQPGFDAIAPNKWVAADKLNPISDFNRPLVLVKAWEPPLGELADYLQMSAGCIVIVNYNEDQILPIKPMQLEEWRRFTRTLTGWTLFVDPQWVPSQ